MGAALGGALRERGHRVLWCSRDRSAETRARALAASLTETQSLRDLVSASSVVISICPPHAALDIAAQVAEESFAGTYVDANAVSPASARQIGALVSRAGATFVDGDVIGGPPRPGGSTRVYLSGRMADEVAALFAGSDRLGTTVLAGPPEAASALKMCYAAWTKGMAALLLTIRAAASALEVEDALLKEWERSQPELIGRFAEVVNSAPPKAWRFAGEMDQIGDAFEAVDVPSEFHRAAAEVYRRLAQFKGGSPGPSVEELCRAVRRRPGG
jgi:3-hydroxyisobutyrate dehydrogenase-like beta-hydroxyacid dehydrogenase